MEDLLAQLRALARRQEEIAERMRDLEARANTSTDSSEKEAARRELKRLSEEQKALARELEDAQQKAGSKDERLSAERAQLETAREAAQKAAAAMEKGALDEARAASSRVSEKLRAGGESLRQQLSGKTREAAKELQEKAQELQEAQKKVAEALSTPKKKPPKLVAEDVRTQAAGQQQRFVKLQSEIQRVAEATESSEPIFSKALQDAHRSTLQNQTEGKLKVVNDALLMRQVEVARRAEKSASKDVEELAKALEVASNDVLGDDVESLRRARAALDEIAKTLGGSNPVAGEGTAPKDGPAKERGKEPIEGDTVKAGEGAQKGTSEGRSPKDVPDRESKGGETAKAGGEAKTETGVGTGKQGGSVAGGGNGVAVQEISDLMERLDRVEALLEKPQLRTGVARVQQVADAIRGDMKRQATKPSRNQVEQKLLAPLAQLRDAISSELARREGRESDVPVDRDPVPRKYEMSVRRYYEALGGGR